MDGEKRLRAYIGPSGAGRIIGLVLLVGALVLAALAIRSAAQPVEDPVRFRTRGMDGGEWCYLDVVGISDWVYRNDDTYYHIAEDAKGNFAVVHISESRYKKMTAQQAYWNEETAVQEPVRITGIAREATATMKSYICQALDINLLDYGTYFGTSYLNAAGSPHSGDTAMLAVMAGVLALIGVILLLTANSTKKKTDRAIEALGGYGVEQAAAELEAPTTERVGRDALRLGETHLFGKRRGLLLRYDQVVWAYQQVQRTNFIVTGRNLLLGDEDGNLTVAASFGRKGEEQITELMRRIAMKNPGVLLGFSADNQKIWRERAKARKNG